MDALVSTRPPGRFRINWWLMNHCNWQCSYCHEILKNGSIDQVELAHALDFVDQLAAWARPQGLVPEWDITGGEVTLWPGLSELLARIQSWDHTVRIRTNASCSVDQFKELITHVNDIELGYHPEHTQTAHFWLCVAAAAAQPGLGVSVVINMLPHRFEETEQLYARIVARWPQLRVQRRMLFDDPAVNTKPKEYTTEQTVKLVRQTGDLKLTLNDREEFTDYQTLVLEGKNQFLGWDCYIGLEQIIVDAYGRVTRGHCRMGGTVGQLGTAINFDLTPVVCARASCNNAFDILATKTFDQTL